MDRADKAKNLFKNGYNCAQAVMCAFCDLTGMDEKTAYTLASSFGGGLGRLREVCGAVSGMAMVAGLLYGYTKEDEPSKKAEHYALIQTLANKFKEQTGGVVCRELLNSKDTTPTPEKRTPQYYQKRPCAELVYLAAKIMQEYIDEHEID
ncbi:MAG: C_GCAxxG_C_C family protein [Ruminococcaceae bacterium]|nr:C_GCAxxG_C_C family protein [Oscillospiraceae bacterium]